MGKIYFVDESIEHRLEKLGISVWKKKPHDEIDLNTYNQYLLNDKYILFFSEMENNENDDDIELFIKSLALSLRATDCRKIETADIQHGIDQVFTFCSESEQLPSRFEKFKVLNFGTIEDICQNKESKVKFLHAIQYSLN